jgi:hypothetical protein
MQLSEVQLDTPGKVLETHALATSTLRVGERGVKSLRAIEDGKIEVVGERVVYHLYPAHVVWTVPLASTAPVQTGEEPVASPPPPAEGTVSDLKVQSDPPEAPGGDAPTAELVVSANGVVEDAQAGSVRGANLPSEPAQPDDVVSKKKSRNRRKRS